ncbi:MAG: hypothetical protein LBQ94_10505 [Treponema sp.]|jgi:hypothetical protein|nr:hypothetical protein [Treponema sp.]
METRKNGLGLPIIALGLDLAPVLVFLLNSIMWSSVALLFVVLFPVAGLIMGIVALTLGKGKISRIGKIISIIAISLPLAVVLFVIVIFIGAVTGLISLM